MFSIPRRKQMNQLPVGAAAAIAAAFNTPIAAVTFTLEEIIGDLNQKLAASIVIAAVISSLIERTLLGKNPLFTGANIYALNAATELIAYTALGITAGVVGVIFSKLILWLRFAFRDRVHVPVWSKPAVGGVLIGVIGLWQPHALGIGYDFLGTVLRGEDQLAMKAVLALMLAKILASAFSYGSGMSGGVLGPSLFVGAMLGNQTSPNGDLFTINARNYPFVGSFPLSAEDPRLLVFFDLRPDTTPLFHHASVDLRFLGSRSAYVALNFSAATADIARKKFEGFYVDNIRVTAVSTN
jgi:hypothetical protein